MQIDTIYQLCVTLNFEYNNDDYRHDSLAMAAAKELRMGSTRNMRRWNPGIQIFLNG